MCAVINYFIGFTEYLLFVQNSDRGLFEAGYFGYYRRQWGIVNWIDDVWWQTLPTRVGDGELEMGYGDVNMWSGSPNERGRFTSVNIASSCNRYYYDNNTFYLI